MSDPRSDRPQYGEYATPEEQRARIQQPDVTDALSAGLAPTGEPVSPVQPSTPWSAAPVTPAARPSSRANQLVTIVLLGFGAVNVLLSIFSYLDIVPAIQRTMDAMGVPGEFTNVASAQMWGSIAAALVVLAYVVTAILTWRRLKAGKLSWWVPLVGAVVSYVLVSVCLVVPLMGDPAFTEFVSGMS